jgi:hypothetical protein
MFYTTDQLIVNAVVATVSIKYLETVATKMDYGYFIYLITGIDWLSRDDVYNISIVDAIEKHTNQSSKNADYMSRRGVLAIENLLFIHLDEIDSNLLPIDILFLCIEKVVEVCLNHKYEFYDEIVYEILHHVEPSKFALNYTKLPSVYRREICNFIVTCDEFSDESKMMFLKKLNCTSLGVQFTSHG